MNVIEPTAEERKNGWTAETLTAYLDTRAATLYAGTTEIMKEIIGRSMGF